MIKLISKQDPQPEAKTKPMYQMQPLEVCVISTDCSYGDHVVMRTASSSHFEVMNLTDPRLDVCWTRKPDIQVRELYPGETYTLELS